MSDSNKPSAKQSTRRTALKKMGGASALIATGMQLPEKWIAPVVDLVILPAHSEGTPLVTSDCGSQGHIKGDANKGCCKDQDHTVPVFLDDCCKQPGLEDNGDLAKDADGNYICCEPVDPNGTGMDPDSDDYKKYCCQNVAKDASGKPIKDANGVKICCEGSAPDPAFCCVKKTLSYSSSISRTRTNWSTTAGSVTLLPIPKWNPTDGPLGRVELSIAAQIDSNGNVENKDLGAVVVTFTASADLSFTAPGLISLALQPAANQQQSLSAPDQFDANGDPDPDGQGTDFWQTPTLDATSSESVSITDTAKLAEYIGARQNLDIIVVANGTSNFIGPGNMAVDINTFASFNITVSYFCDASD